MTNFIRKHSLLAMLFVSVMILNLTSCLSTADLTKSQRVGAKHSPAAIYAVSVHGNAGVYAVDAVKKYMNEALTNDAGFTLLDQETMDVVCDEAKKKSIEKAKKRAGFKNVMGVLSGRKSIAGAIHDGMSLDDVGYKRKDVFKAVSKMKGVKCKSFIFIKVNAGVREKDNRVKPVATTLVCIYNKGDKLLKQITAISSIDPIDVIDEESKEAVFAAFPELVEKSMALAALNMHKKDGFFQINALKEDTTEIVTSEFWPVGLKVYE